MNENQDIKTLFLHLFQHIDVAIVTGRAGSLDFHSLMYICAVGKALQYSSGCGEEQDVIDYVDAYYCMLETLSDIYPILPD